MINDSKIAKSAQMTLECLIKKYQAIEEQENRASYEKISAAKNSME